MRRSEYEILETQLEEIFIELSKYYMKLEAQEAEYKKMMEDARTDKQ